MRLKIKRANIKGADFNLLPKQPTSIKHLVSLRS